MNERAFITVVVVEGTAEHLATALPFVAASTFRQSLERPSPLGHWDRGTRRVHFVRLALDARPRHALSVRTPAAPKLSPAAMDALRSAESLTVYFPEPLAQDDAARLDSELAALGRPGGTTFVADSGTELSDALDRALPISDERTEALATALSGPPRWRAFFDACFVLERFDADERDAALAFVETLRNVGHSSSAWPLATGSLRFDLHAATYSPGSTPLHHRAAERSSVKPPALAKALVCSVTSRCCSWSKRGPSPRVERGSWSRRRSRCRLARPWRGSPKTSPKRMRRSCA